MCAPPPDRLSCLREGGGRAGLTCSGWDRAAPPEACLGVSCFITEPVSPAVSHQEAAIGASATTGLHVGLRGCQDLDPVVYSRAGACVQAAQLPDLGSSFSKRIPAVDGFPASSGAWSPQSTSHQDLFSCAKKIYSSH